MSLAGKKKVRARKHSQLQQPYEQLENRQLLATLTVTTFDDVVDSGDGLLSLREAITLANSNGETDVINLAAGTYQLSLNGGAENGNMTGDLDVMPDGGNGLTIQGAGTGSTTIDAARIDRILDVQIGSDVSLNGLTLTGGALTGAAQTELRGAGIRSFHSSINLNDVIVTANGGDTVASGMPIFGGGMFVAGGDVNLLRSEFSHNSALREGAAVYLRSVDADIRLVNVNRNESFQRLSSFVARDSDIDVRQFKFDLNQGGFHTVNGSAEFKHVRFYGNQAAYQSDGAIRTYNTALDADGLRMVGNGTGVNVTAAPQEVEITNSLFIDNDWGLRYFETSIQIVDTRFEENFAALVGRNVNDPTVFSNELESLEFVNNRDSIDIVAYGESVEAEDVMILNDTELGDLPFRVVSESAELNEIDVNGNTRKRGLTLEVVDQAVVTNSYITNSGGLSLWGEGDIVNTTIHDNFFSGDGGAIYWRPNGDNAELNVINSTISKNRVRWSSRSSIAGNVTFRGGNGAAIFVENAITGNATGVTVNSINTAFIANQASNEGVFEVSSNSTIEFNFYNSILWNNFSPLSNAGTLFRGDFTVNAMNNIASEVAPGDAAALFLPANNNSDSNPIFIDYANDDFRLQSNSPAIDAGDNSFLVADQYDVDDDMDTAEFTPDLDLLDRVFGGVVDIGPYEFR